MNQDSIRIKVSASVANIACGFDCRWVFRIAGKPKIIAPSMYGDYFSDGSPCKIPGMY
ncbi:MAG: hypothetical protein IIB95_03145 [Candidatus Marinimicrobia bacterium]|nr:hypothetical protein [Candidatus Neomarinimicrobiota bacterium]MCH7762723.1 hypothetical protein [Candidatus Neomarinimicrobiota bacterium]